jgi:hypothetical protein
VKKEDKMKYEDPKRALALLDEHNDVMKYLMNVAEHKEEEEIKAEIKAKRKWIRAAMMMMMMMMLWISISLGLVKKEKVETNKMEWVISEGLVTLLQQTSKIVFHILDNISIFLILMV